MVADGGELDFSIVAMPTGSADAKAAKPLVKLPIHQVTL